MNKAKEVLPKYEGGARQDQGGLCQGNKVALDKAKEAYAKVTKWRWIRPRRPLPR
jgi:hypothetical protein